MTSSGKSSPTSPGVAPRKRFVLVGRSAAVDPLRNAVRADLADIALADTIFAPHYAKALAARLTCPATLREKPRGDAGIVAELEVGLSIELFDIGGIWAWVRACGQMGYVPTAAIAVSC